MSKTALTNVVIDTADLEQVEEILNGAGIFYSTEAR